MLPIKKIDSTDIIETVISYINEHFKEDLPDKVLASAAGLSSYHFIRVFKRETGFTPHEYVINTRLSNARYLLRNTAMSVKDICFSCGFSSESALLHNLFKKRAKNDTGSVQAKWNMIFLFR